MPPHTRSSGSVAALAAPGLSRAQRAGDDARPAGGAAIGRRLLLAPLVTLALVLMIGLGLGLLLAERLVLEDARFVAASTSDHLRNSVPGLETILANRRIGPAQRQALRAASDRSRVVDLALLDAEGRPFARSRQLLATTTPERQDPGLAQQLLARALASRRIEAAVAAVDQPGWPAHLGEAMVPVVRDGRLLGLLHVSIDLADKVEVYRRTFLWAVVVMVALFVLAALVPGAVLWRRLKALEAVAADAHHLAFHDTLTGLPNRLLFQDRLAQAIARVRRDGGRGALLMLDLDDFKAVNDALGHAAGDQLLQAVAGRLVQGVRATDTVARLGGDEFAVIVAPLGGLEGLDAVLERIGQELARSVAIDGRAVTASATIGVALFPDDGDEPDRLVRRADGALYRGKAKGRGAVVWHLEPERAAAVAEAPPR